MKKSKEKIITEKVNQSFNRSARVARYFHWGIKPRNPSLGNPPTAKELATLAAALARTSNEEHQKLCSNALNLWFTATEALSLQKNCNEDYQNADTETADFIKKLPQPDGEDFPMKLDMFLQRLWPEMKDTGIRANVFKKWIRYAHEANRRNMADLNSLPAPAPMTENEITDEFAKWRAKGIVDNRAFQSLSANVMRWYLTWKPTANSAVKSNNAKESWADCDAKTQRTAEYQEYKADCEKRGTKTNRRGFKKWLVSRKESPGDKDVRFLKKILSPA